MIKDQLSNQKDRFEKAADPHVVKTFHAFQDHLDQDPNLKTYLREGDAFPRFTLNNAIGQAMSLDDFLSQGPLVCIA